MSDQTITIPGVGPVIFPASMSDAEIEAAAAKLHREANIAAQAPALDRATANVPSGPLEYAARMGKGALQELGVLVEGLDQGMRRSANIFDASGSPERPPTLGDIGDALIGGPQRILGAVNTDDPELAGREAVEAATYLPMGGRALRNPAQAIRNVPADLATVGRGAGAVVTHPAFPYAMGAIGGLATDGVPGMITGLKGAGAAHGIRLGAEILNEMRNRRAQPQPPPVAPPGASPAPPGAAAAPAAAADPAAALAAWEADQRARAAVKDDIARTSAMNRAKAKADARSAYPQTTKPTQPAPAPMPTTPVPSHPVAPAAAPPSVAPAAAPPGPPAATAPPPVPTTPGAVNTQIASEAAARITPPPSSVGALTGDAALRQAAINNFTRQLDRGAVNPMANVEMSALSGNNPGRLLPGVDQPAVRATIDALLYKYRKGTITVAEETALKEALARLSQDERVRTGTRGSRSR